MGAGRPVAPISKVRPVTSGLSITINTDGAMIDAYVVTDRPLEVEQFMQSRAGPADRRGTSTPMSFFAVKAALARAAGVASRLTGRGATSLPGTVLLALDPTAI